MLVIMDRPLCPIQIVHFGPLGPSTLDLAHIFKYEHFPDRVARRYPECLQILERSLNCTKCKYNWSPLYYYYQFCQ